MPSDFQLKTMNAVHHLLLKVSFGKFGWTAGKMPALELTTIGRKSGLARTVMLTSPHQIGDSIVIIASRGGDDTHPAWFVNLRDNPAVQVSYMGAPKVSMNARLANPEERAEIWPQVISKFARYGGYQEKTERVIPVVLLEPNK